MKIYEKLELDTFNQRIQSYANSALDGLRNFFECNAFIVENNYIEKENFIDNSRVVFLMNIKRIKENEIDNQYAFFYISFARNEFLKFSELVCQKNGMPANDINIRISAVQECCNRIGVKLLQFIDEEGYVFHIGAPVILPMSCNVLKGKEIDSSKIIQLWPVNFYKVRFSVDNIQMYFGCTILESSEQRYNLLTQSIIDIVSQENEVTIETETIPSNCPSMFDLHYVVTLVTEEQVIISFAMRHLSQVMQLFEIIDRSEKTQKDEVLQYIRSNINVKNIEIYERSYPDIQEDCLIKIAKITHDKNKALMAITAIV